MKQIIDEILRINLDYQHGLQAFNQAQSLKAVSEDLYTDPIRFIFELIQNSDDAYSGHPMKNPLLRLSLIDEQYLMIGNYGKPFDENDIRSVCRVGYGTKRSDSDKIGYKGLGFKAVFSQSDYVLIASKGSYFRFEANANDFKWNPKWAKDQQTWEQSTGLKFEYPWQICPLWTEINQIPKSIQTWLSSQPDIVACILRLKNTIGIKTSLKSLIEQPHVFMFLKNIRDIRILFEPTTEICLTISQLKDGSIKISSTDQRISSHWLLHSCVLSVPNQVLNDSRLLEKHRQIKQVEMALAAQIDKNDRIIPVQGTDSILFAYLPTRISTYNLPILVNTNFLVNASREHIHIDSPWNQWLFSSIPRATFEWVRLLTKLPKWTDKAYDLLPNPISAKDALATEYNEACERSLKEVPFVLAIDKGSVMITAAVIDITTFSSSECLGHEIMRDYIVQTSKTPLDLPANPFVKNHHRLNNLRIRQFNWEMLYQMIQSRFFLTKFTVRDDKRFISYLYQHRESTQIQKRLYDIPFLMDTAGFLRRIREIYFPSRFSSADWLMLDSGDAYVHSDVMEWLQKQPNIKDWLKRLGVEEKTDLKFVDNYIIPHVDHYINENNAIVTIQRLFNLFCIGSLTNQQMSQLCRLKLLTAGGELIPGFYLYFSDAYGPQLPLDDFNLDPNLFLSPIYLDHLGDTHVDRVKSFFRCLAVQENIDFYPFNDRFPDSVTAEYINSKLRSLPPYAIIQGFQHRLTIEFIEWTQSNYTFALFFWEHVMRMRNFRRLMEPEGIFTQQRRIATDNLPQWFVRTYPCIPTTTGELLSSFLVFSSDLRPIAGRYLPVFACDTRIPLPDLWQNFFGFKKELGVNDYLLILSRIHHQSTLNALTDEDHMHLQNVYSALIDCLTKIKRVDRTHLQVPVPFSLLSTIGNQFRSITELVFSVDPALILPSSIPQLRLNETNTRHTNLKLLLELFRIRQVTLNDLALKEDLDAQVSRSLQKKLRDIQPYLFALADSKKIQNHTIDRDLEIFEADSLELLYKRTILIQQVPVYLKTNQLFIKRPWNNDETMNRLPSILSELFTLPVDFAFEIKQLLLASTFKSISDEFLERNIPIQSHHFHDDPLSTGGTREKFAQLIDRDNAKLFQHLRVEKTMKPAELLLVGLNAQESPWTGYVYHFTHLENAQKILSEKTLKSRALLNPTDFHDSAAENVIRATRPEVKNYVRFYFRPLTPTQRCNENLGVASLAERYGNKLMCPIPVFLRFNLRSLLAIENLPWKISLRNLASQHTQFDSTKKTIEKFDFDYVYADTRTERGKFSSQHEFLIESELDLNRLTNEDISIIFQDENAQSTFIHLVDQIDYRVEIDSKYFFGYNPRVLVDYVAGERLKISVKIDYGMETHDPGKLLVQIRTPNPTKTITGNLMGMFERDGILVLLGREQIHFLPEMNDVEFAVYYKLEKHVWLIYTNYDNPSFKSPEIQTHS